VFRYTAQGIIEDGVDRMRLVTTYIAKLIIVDDESVSVRSEAVLLYCTGEADKDDALIGTTDPLVISPAAGCQAFPLLPCGTEQPNKILYPTNGFGPACSVPGLRSSRVSHQGTTPLARNCVGEPVNAPTPHLTAGSSHTAVHYLYPFH
jgi:hypothetical protein